jgi:ligand-binding sensor domain-containing protein
MNSRIRYVCRRISLTLLFTLAIFSSLFPQNYNIKTFTTDNGLSHNNVREMVFDSTGFLWIGTWDGLNRYDGYSFVKYSHTPGDSTSLPYFSVRGLLVDGSDNLWILTDNGYIAKFNRKTNNFTKIARINGEKAPPMPNFACDYNGNIWLISLKSFYLCDHLTGNFTKYSVILPDGADAIDQASRYSVTCSGENIFWLSGTVTYEIERNDSLKTLTVKNIFKLKTKELPKEKMIRNYDHSFWSTMYSDPAGRKWMFSNNGLFLLDKTNGSFDEFSGEIPLHDFTGQKIFYWGSLTGGLNIYRPGTGKVISIPEGSVQLLKNVAIRGRDMIWYSNTSFTGNSMGLSRIIFTPDYFKKYNVDTETDKLPAVYSVTVDNQKQVWLGIRGRDHLVVITPDNRILKKYTPASDLPGYYGPVRSLRRVQDGIWIGYFYQMLLFYDYKTESFREYKTEPYYYRDLEVRSDGKLYTGNTQLILLDPVTLQKKILCDSLFQGGNFRFNLEKDGTLWSGMPAGSFLRYIPSENRTTIFLQKGVPNNVEDVCPGENGDVWLALLGGGLERYNTKTGTRKMIYHKPGIIQ